jgi:4-amino-4-deoxy-L-arabinose transferase-like glycosyltransferase
MLWMYGLFKINYYKIIFVGILILAIFLRFFQLGINPPSLDWDEVSLGYNAYSLLKTGADEYGEILPVTIRSFDDHKPPVYVYLTVPAVAIFGLNEFSVRLPSALIGVLTVVITMLLVSELFSRVSLSSTDKQYFLNALHRLTTRPYFTKVLALVSGFLLAVSPWHLQFSRAAFEGNVGLFFLLSGVYLFVIGLRKQKMIFLSAVAFVLCMYSYHSFRLITPILLGVLFLLFLKNVIVLKRSMLFFMLILCIGVFPVFVSFFSASGSGSRLSMVTIFTQDELQKGSLVQLTHDQQSGDSLGSLLHNRRIVYFLAGIKGYFDHWNPDFLFLHGDGGRQHHAVDMGMLYLWELPFIIVGGFCMVLLLNRRTGIILVILFLAPLASSITTGTPHPVRAIAMIPSLHILTALGFLQVISLLFSLRFRAVRTFAIILILSGFFINAVYYFHQYYIHTPIQYGDFWQYGSKEAVLEAKGLESKYDKIIMTYTYDQPYIYYLFHQKIDPAWYQQNWDYNGNGEIERMRRVIGKYEFRNIDFQKDGQIPHTLLIGSPREIPENANNILKTIYFPDGSVAFRIVGT